MRRRTISEKGVEEQSDRSLHHTGELIACYNDLASSEGIMSIGNSQADEFVGYNSPKSSSQLRELNDQSKNSISMQDNHNMLGDLGSRSDNPKKHMEFVSTGNRLLNDMTRIDDYQSKRDSKVNVNSFLNSYGQRSSMLQDRFRVFSKQNKYKKEKSPGKFIRSHEHPSKLPVQLTTIPENDPETAQFEYLTYLNRHNKIKRKDEYFHNLINYNKYLQKYEDVHSNSFQQAKFKFYDRFMPEELKIGKNPYKLLKYNQNNKQWRQMLERLG